MGKLKIVIAAGEKSLCQNLQACLRRNGFEVIPVREMSGIPGVIQNRKPALVILDSSDDLKITEQIRRQNKNIPIILITRQSSEARVLAALRAGVNDYFTLPFSHDTFAASVRRLLLNTSELTQEILPAAGQYHTQPMIGRSPVMDQIKAYLLKIAKTDSTVLITGETGTGKELAAEAIHRNSPRSQNPFICINCAALPESLVESELFGYKKGAFTGANTSRQGGFERANGGTVFLDEIGDMSAGAQVKILRTIERKEVCHLGGRKAIPLNIRVIAATNQELEVLVETDRFRKDLYYRLNVARLHLPPLRERKEDIPHMIGHYIQIFNAHFDRQVEGFTEEALAILLHYDWPGNIRELKNLLEATFINLPTHRIRFMELPEPFQRKLEDTKDLPKSERDQILSALFATSWNKSQAAQKLNWSRMTLYRKMAKYHIQE